MLGAAHSHADEKKCRVVCAGLIQDERDEHRVSYRVFFKRSRHRHRSPLPNQVMLHEGAARLLKRKPRQPARPGRAGVAGGEAWSPASQTATMVSGLTTNKSQSTKLPRMKEPSDKYKPRAHTNMTLVPAADPIPRAPLR